MNSLYLDILVVLLVVIDVFLVTTEIFIDAHLLCIRPTHVNVSPQEVVDLVPASKVYTRSRLSALLEVPWATRFPDSHSDSDSSSAAGGQKLATEGHEATLPTHHPRTKTSTRIARMLSLVVDAHGSTVGADANMDAMTAASFGEVQAAQASTITLLESHAAGALICEDRGGPVSHSIAHNAHLASICILAVFFFELCLKLMVDPEEFCHSWMHIFDFFIVTISLFMDTVMHRYFQEVVAVLIIMRMWRVVRIAHGFIELYDNEAEARVRIEEEVRHKVREEVRDEVIFVLSKVREKVREELREEVTRELSDAHAKALTAQAST